jgi:hypothetical protein
VTLPSAQVTLPKSILLIVSICPTAQDFGCKTWTQARPALYPKRR